MRAGLRSRVARLARRAGGYSAPVLLAAIAAGVLAPLITSGVGAAAIGAVAAVGGNVLTDLVKAAVDRLRPGEAVEPALEAALREALTGEDSAVLRAEIASVLREVGAVTVALDAAGDDVRADLATGFADLGGRFAEFAFLRAELREALDDLQIGLDRQGAAQQVIIDLLHRQSTEVRLVRSALERRAAEEGPNSRWPGPPYRGLQPFTEDQAEVFHGRERLVADLTGLLSRHGRGLYVVTGASGVGKSSLVQAGLLPALARERPGRPCRVITPGLLRLAVTLAAMASVDAVSVFDALVERPASAGVLADQAAGDDLVLVVDQFEQIFATGEAEAFVTALAAMTATVVVVVRGDFIDRCAAHPALVGALRDRQFVVGPMEPGELRRAITGPADAAGLEIEPGLTDTILAELSGPGALPLLSQAMLTTWEHRDGNRLTARGYALSGGVAKAVETAAEAAYAELTPDQQTAARVLFTDLTGVDDEIRLVRRTIDAPADAVAGAVAEAFARRRLITVGDGVQISHDALLTTWPRLRGWLEEDLAGHRLRSQFLDDAHDWDDHGRDPSFLYRGARLTVVQRAATTWHLPAPADAYLRTATREATRGSRIRRSVAAVLVLLLVGAVTAAGWAITSARQADRLAARAATGERVATARALTTQAGTVRGSDPGGALNLGLGAYRLSPGPETRADLVSTLAGPFLGELRNEGGAAAVDISPDGRLLVVGLGGVMNFDDLGGIQVWDIADPLDPRLLARRPGGHANATISVDVDPAGKLAATSSVDRTVVLWDLADPRSPRPFPAPISRDDLPNVAAFAPVGATLAVGGDGLTFWDVTDPAHPRQKGDRLAVPGDPRLVSGAYRWDGERFAAVYNDGTVVVWDLRTGRFHPVTSKKGGAPQSVAYSGDRIAVDWSDQEVTLWDVADLARPKRLGEPLTSQGGLLTSVAFSPSGGLLAVDGPDGVVTLRDLRDPARPVAVGSGLPHRDTVSTGLVFSPDGRTLVSTSYSGAATLWDVDAALGLRMIDPVVSRSPQAEGVRGDETGNPAHVDFSPDGRLLAAGEGDHVLLLNAATRNPIAYPLRGHTSIVKAVAFSPDGTRLVTASADELLVWDLADPSGPHRLGAPLRRDPGVASFVTFAPDGRLLAGTGHFGVTAWDVTGPVLREIGVPEGLGQPLVFSRQGLFAVAPPYGAVVLWDEAGPVATLREVTGPAAFSPDGRYLAAADGDGRISLFDIADPARPLLVSGPLSGHSGYVNTLAFSPDGRLLVSGGREGALFVRDLTDPHRPHVLAGPIALPDEATSAVFAPDGRTLAIAGWSEDAPRWDQSVTLWDVSRLSALQRDPVARACAITRGGPSLTDWTRNVPALRYENACP